MKVFEIENQRVKLKSFIRANPSIRQRLLGISGYFNVLLEFENPLIVEAFVFDFIEEYINCFGNFDPRCIKPELVKNLSEQISALSKFAFLKKYNSQFFEINDQLLKNYSIVEHSLEGKLPIVGNGLRKLFVPLLEEVQSPENENKDVFGILETITVNVRETKIGNHFIIVPSGNEIEKRIDNQIKMSWHIAEIYVRKFYKKLNDSHEIIIKFDKQAGYCIGASLGVALTIGFIEELLKHYNSPVVVNIKENIATTGVVDESGKILALSDDIIIKKVESVFYSEIETFVIPKKDELAALNKIEELKTLYPKRNLEIIGVTDLDDLLNRRNLVDIRKLAKHTRTVKFFEQNIISSISVVLMLIMLSYSFLYNRDDQPYLLERHDHLLEVRNSHNKIMWTKKVDDFVDEKYSNNLEQMLLDVNNDGRNEVLVTSEAIDDLQNRSEYGRVACFTAAGNLLWKYSFKDSVSAGGDVYPKDFRVFFIGTGNKNGKKEIYLFANNYPYYPSAVFRLNARNGARLKGTLWNSGRISDGLLKKMSNGKTVLYLVGVNNSYDHSFISSIDVDKLDGTSPAAGNYFIDGKEVADFNNYVILPKTDLCKDKLSRFNTPIFGSLKDIEQTKEIQITTMEGEENSNLDFRFDYSLNHPDVIIIDRFAMRRDKLVTEGELEKPLSNTKAYLSLLENQFLYWNGQYFSHNQL